VILCGRASEDEVLRAIAAGAAGYVAGGDSLADLQRVIQSVGQGGAQCSAGAAQALLENIRRLAGASSARQTQPLTAQEQEVFGLLAQRLRNKEIARRLGLTLPAVKSHVHRVLKKLRVRSRREAARCVTI
jgi:DNA-binding NarL/FixJ family response regulator